MASKREVCNDYIVLYGSKHTRNDIIIPQSSTGQQRARSPTPKWNHWHLRVKSNAILCIADLSYHLTKASFWRFSLKDWKAEWPAGLCFYGTTQNLPGRSSPTSYSLLWGIHLGPCQQQTDTDIPGPCCQRPEQEGTWEAQAQLQYRDTALLSPDPLLQERPAEGVWRLLLKKLLPAIRHGHSESASTPDGFFKSPVELFFMNWQSRFRNPFVLLALARLHGEWIHNIMVQLCEKLPNSVLNPIIPLADSSPCILRNWLNYFTLPFFMRVLIL